MQLSESMTSVLAFLQWRSHWFLGQFHEHPRYHHDNRVSILQRQLHEPTSEHESWQ